MKNILIFCFFCLISCKKEASISNITSVDLKITSDNAWLDVSEFYDAEFIVLETTKESRIGTIKKILLYKEEFYIFDSQQEKILVFGIDGSFNRQIGIKGKGVGEILKMPDFDIYNDLIYISSLGNNKMLIFDLTGKLKKEIMYSDYIGMRFQVIESGFVSNAGGASNKAATFYSYRGKKQKVDVNETYFDLRYLPMNNFTTNSDSLFMLFSNNDTIYSIDEDHQRLVPYYYVDLNGMNVPIEELKTNERLKNYKKNNSYYQIWKFFYNSPISYFLLTNDKKFCHVFYDMNTTDYKYAERLSYKDFQIVEIVGECDNSLIATWHPYMVSSYKKNEKKHLTLFQIHVLMLI